MGRFERATTVNLLITCYSLTCLTRKQSAQGRTIKMAEPSVSKASMVLPSPHDPNSSPTNDQITTYNYDAADQLTSVLRADGSTISNEYWADGQLKAQRDGLNTAILSYDHDSRGWLRFSTDALG